MTSELAKMTLVLSQQFWGPRRSGASHARATSLRGHWWRSPSLSLSLPQACHTGMRSYIYNKNSLIGSQAEHCGMRTYYFSADTQEDMNGWIRAMNQSALMQSHGVKRSVSSCCCNNSSLRAAVSTKSVSKKPGQYMLLKTIGITLTNHFICQT